MEVKTVGCTEGQGLADEEIKEGIQLPIVWVGAEDVPIVLINQFIGQVGLQDEVVLTFGQLAQPPLVGTPEEQEEQAREISFVSVKPVARLGLTKAGLDQLVGVLQQTQKNYEQALEHRVQRARESDEG